MKVALCISGQPRGLKIAGEYVKRNLLDVLQPDVFIHSWTPAMPDETIDEVVDLYDPKAFVNQQYFAPAYFEKYTRLASPQHPAYNTGHMMASVYMANELKRQHELSEGFRYDVVIRSRFDYALNRQIILPVEPGKLYVPNCRIHPQHALCNDQFAWGTSEVLDAYSMTFPEMDYLYSVGFIYNGEDMLSGNLQMHNLTGANMVYVDMHNPFPPGQYNSTTHSLVRDDFRSYNDLRG